MTDTVESLIAYCQENGRVCPQPTHWHRLWELLPKAERQAAAKQNEAAVEAPTAPAEKPAEIEQPELTTPRRKWPH